MSQRFLKLTVSSTETVFGPAVQRGTLHQEPTSLSVMLMDSTHLCRSASY